MDECELDLDDCDVNAECENGVGNFTCACGSGYEGNGTSCQVLLPDKQSAAIRHGMPATLFLVWMAAASLALY